MSSLNIMRLMTFPNVFYDPASLDQPLEYITNSKKYRLIRLRFHVLFNFPQGSFRNSRSNPLGPVGAMSLKTHRNPRLYPSDLTPE